MTIDPAIQSVFKAIQKEIPGMSVREYPSTPGKIGLRFHKGEVALTHKPRS